MLISGVVLAAGGVVVGSWGIESYRNKRKRPSLIQILSPDRLIPPSPKVQNEIIYAAQSPWKEHVIEVAPANKDETMGETMGKVSEKADKFSYDDMRLVMRYVRRYWSPYAVISVATGVALMSFAGYQLFYAYTMKVAVDNILVAGGWVLVRNALIKLAIALPAAVGLMLAGEWLGARLSSRIINDIRYDLFAHLQELPSTFHKEARLGDLLARFSTDMEKIELVLGRELTGGIGDLIMLLVNLGVMIYLSLPLAFISLLPLFLMLRPLMLTSQTFFETGYAMHKQKGLMTNAAQEGIRAHSLSESFAIGDFIRRCFGDELAKLEKKNSEALFGRALFIHTAGLSYMLLRLGTLSAGMLLVFGGSMTLGSLLAAMTVSESFYFHYGQLANHRMTQWIEASVGLRRLDELFQQQPSIMDTPDALTLPPFHHALCFKQVTFSYNEQENAHEESRSNGQRQAMQLSNINLTIEAGQFVAFVGPSGAGKSTVFNLLMRFYDVTSGQITIDGHDLRDVSLASLRAQMGVVLQETFLFNTTIEDNIRIVKPNATKREVIAAAQAAELHDFILSLPDGYQTIVGENGGRLSGGQRQRIAIARALLVNPAILLLDEATSSLDVDTAARVNATLRRVAMNRTVIMITHYLPAVIYADTIFVLKEGHLLEQGKHDTLLAQAGVYSQLWQTQTDHSPSPI